MADGADIRLFRGVEGLRRLSPEWSALAARIPGRLFYHLPEWSECLLTGLEERPDDVLFAAVRVGGATAAVLPLRAGVKRQLGLPLRVFELPEHPHMAVGDFVAVPGFDWSEAMPDLFAALRGAGFRPRVFCLQEIVAGSGAMPPSLAEGRANAVVHQTDVRYTVEAVSYETLSERFRRTHRKSLRNRERRLARLGAAVFQSASVTGDLEEAFPAFVSVESAGWKGQGGTAIGKDPRLVEFYRGLMRRFGAAGACHINRLMLDGRTIAAQFCLVTDGNACGLKFGYDEEFAALAPGDLLLAAVLRHYGAEPAVRRLSFLSGADFYAKWGPAGEPVHTVWVFEPTPRGRAARALVRFRGACRRAVRAARRAVPPGHTHAA